MDHCRCFRCYIPTTRAERISDTITFVPYHVSIPNISRDDLIYQALQKIEKLATNPPPKVTAIMEQADTTDIIDELAKIFKPTLKKSRSDSSEINSQIYFQKHIPNRYNLPAPTNMPTVPSISLKDTVLSPRVKESINVIKQTHDNSPNVKTIRPKHPREP